MICGQPITSIVQVISSTVETLCASLVAIAFTLELLYIIWWTAKKVRDL